MATTRYVSQINGSPIFATRAEYTKSGVDIDEALSGIANGVFEVVNLTTGANPHPDVQNPSHKIIYLTKESGSSKTDPYTEWIYTQSSAWEVIGETSIDLSNYYNKTETNNLLDDKVDKVSGKGLSTNDYTTTEKTKLAGISEGANKVESSTTNGNIKIEGTETTVYTHPTTAGNEHIPSGGSTGQVLVYGGSSGTASWGNAPADSTKADKVSNATSGDFAGLDSNGNLTDSGKKASDFATSAQGSKADSAIQGVKVNGTSLTPDSNMVVDILPATSAAYGVVQLGYVDL